MLAQLRRALSGSPLEPLAISLKLHSDVSAWQCRRAVSAWEKNGFPVPPPFGYKRGLLRDYAIRFGLETMIETGTYMGHMCLAQQSIFSKIVTIELDPRLHALAKKRFARAPHIECLHGDSSEWMPVVLRRLEKPCLFWLDAHYSAGATAKGQVETPISAELDAILNHAIRNHVVLIDDARDFNGTHDYPHLDRLKATVTGLRPDLTFAVERDIIRITPSEGPPDEPSHR
jgi:hypothetical protein